jgi:hypothetical protein
MASEGRSRTGTSRLKSYFAATPSSSAVYQALPSPVTRNHGAMAPWANDRPRFGMIRSGSNSRVVPRPLQTGQAPCGELKEKLRGSISVSPTTPCTGHENFSEKTIGSPSMICASGDTVGDLQRRLQ